jgi:hypothetical protein
VFGDNDLELGIMHLAPLNLDRLLIFKGCSASLTCLHRVYFDFFWVLYQLQSLAFMSLLPSGGFLSFLLWVLGSPISIRGWRLTSVPTGPVQSGLQLGYPGFQ